MKDFSDQMVHSSEMGIEWRMDILKYSLPERSTPGLQCSSWPRETRWEDNHEQTLAKRPNNRKSLETVVVLVNCWFWDLPNAICYDLWIWDRCFSWPAHIVPQGQCTSSKWGWQWTQVDFTSKISSFPPPTNPPARPTQHVLSLVACYESWAELCCVVLSARVS